MRAARSIRPADMTEALAESMAVRGARDHMRADNGPGCARVAGAGGSQEALHRAWGAVGERLASFNGKSGKELLDREVFYTLLEARVLTARYRRTYNQVRPHRSPGRRPPAPSCLPTLSPRLSD